MTRTGVPFAQQQDGSWALPCGCVLHLYDGKDGPLEPHLHPCAVHEGSFKDVALLNAYGTGPFISADAISRERPDARRLDHAS